MFCKAGMQPNPDRPTMVFWLFGSFLHPFPSLKQLWPKAAMSEEEKGGDYSTSSGFW